MYDFGVRLRELREKRNLSQGEVAKRLNLNKTTISNYECNIRTPTVETLSSMALLFNVTADYLLGLDHRFSISVGGLSHRQQELITLMLDEFRNEPEKV